MDLLSLLSPSCITAHVLIGMISKAGIFTVIEIHKSLDSLFQRLQFPLPNPTILLIAISTEQHLNQLLVHKNLFTDIPLVLLVIHHLPEMLTLGHRLRPRLLVPIGTDVQELITVLTKMARSLRQREEDLPWPEERPRLVMRARNTK